MSFFLLGPSLNFYELVGLLSLFCTAVLLLFMAFIRFDDRKKEKY
jgi:hypothetical protein